jgi:hypothetical protein
MNHDVFDTVEWTAVDVETQIYHPFTLLLNQESRTHECVSLGKFHLGRAFAPLPVFANGMARRQREELPSDAWRVNVIYIQSKYDCHYI